MAANPTDPKSSSSPPPVNTRYRSTQDQFDADGRRTGNYETFPVAEGGQRPRPEIPKLAKPRVRFDAGDEDLTLMQAIRTLTYEDFKKLPLQVCVRESLLTGLLSGFAVGGTKAILGAGIGAAANWAVGAFACGSVAAHEYCQWGRSREIQNMQKAVEVLHTERKQKREEKEKVKAEARGSRKKDDRARTDKERQHPQKWRWFWASPEPPNR